MNFHHITKSILSIYSFLIDKLINQLKFGSSILFMLLLLSLNSSWAKSPSLNSFITSWQTPTANTRVSFPLIVISGTERLFVINNGTSSEKRNAFVMFKNRNTTFSGQIRSATITYPNISGTEDQVLITDALGTATWTTPNVAVTYKDVDYVISSSASQTSFIFSHTAPPSTSKLKMFINQILISNTAYNVNGSILTYNSIFNGNKTMLSNDRIQFEY